MPLELLWIQAFTHPSFVVLLLLSFLLNRTDVLLYPLALWKHLLDFFLQAFAQYFTEDYCEFGQKLFLLQASLLLKLALTLHFLHVFQTGHWLTLNGHLLKIGFQIILATERRRFIRLWEEFHIWCTTILWRRSNFFYWFFDLLVGVDYL